MDFYWFWLELKETTAFYVRVIVIGKVSEILEELTKVFFFGIQIHDQKWFFLTTWWAHVGRSWPGMAFITESWHYKTCIDTLEKNKNIQYYYQL